MLLLRKSLLVVSLIFTSAYCFAQVTEKWVKRQNGDPVSVDVPNDLAVDQKGNVNDGDLKWERRYNGPGNGADIATAVDLDDNGHVFVTGRSEGNGSGFDYATIKYEQTPVLTRSSTGHEQDNVP
jgi:hypothetical protein